MMYYYLVMEDTKFQILYLFKDRNDICPSMILHYKDVFDVFSEFNLLNIKWFSWWEYPENPYC